MSSGNPLEVLVASAAVLTFTPSNWDVAQEVRLVGVADLLVDGNKVVTITVAVMDASSDDSYDGLVEEVTVTNVDTTATP